MSCMLCCFDKCITSSQMLCQHLAVWNSRRSDRRPQAAHIVRQHPAALQCTSQQGLDTPVCDALHSGALSAWPTTAPKELVGRLAHQLCTVHSVPNICTPRLTWTALHTLLVSCSSMVQRAQLRLAAAKPSNLRTHSNAAAYGTETYTTICTPAHAHRHTAEGTWAPDPHHHWCAITPC
jgi:hypothetical protein